jgi:hypothetical protein
MQFRYTAHEVARGSRPDAVKGGVAYLFKNVSLLRLTYQVRLLTFLATEQGTRLVVVIPKSTKVSNELRAFARAHTALKIERAK